MEPRFGRASWGENRHYFEPVQRFEVANRVVRNQSGRVERMQRFENFGGQVGTSRVVLARLYKLRVLTWWANQVKRILIW